VVKRTLDGSQPDWNYVAPLSPPEGAPDNLLILTDDAGFGNPGTFGGPIRTAALDRLAAAGLKYNGFHVTAMCSPTREALMTGRNHHAVGFGMVSEFAGPFPGYSAMLPKDCQPFVKTLQGNGYPAACFGKWHLAPDHMQAPGGPFDRWPNALGFDYFWGFLGGERDHKSLLDAVASGGSPPNPIGKIPAPPPLMGELFGHVPQPDPDVRQP